MSKFVLEIETDNDAFADDEVGRIMINVSTRFRNGEQAGPIHDINGNRVGTFGFRE